LTADSRKPSPSAFGKVIVSIARIHFGISGSTPGFGRPRHWRRASRSSSAPSTIWITPLTGCPPSASSSGRTDDSSVNTVTATTIPSTQPSRKPVPVTRAFGDSSMRMAAMIGMGLIATPSAGVRMSPMTAPMAASWW
jgi:hypothetical protein